MLNLISRWILSPLESVPSPMVEDWQAEAQARGCTPEQIDHVCAMAEELYPPYELPVARQYGHQWDAPFHGAGFALVYCEMDITHLATAQADPRLTIFNSLDDGVHQAAVDAHAHLFDPPQVTDVTHVTSATPARQAVPSTLRELLKELSARHIKFSASE
jgi:hypothetical protein